MQIDQLLNYLDEPGQAAGWLKSLRLADLDRAHANFVALASSGMTLDLLAVISKQLESHLAGVSDPDMALNNFERFVAASRSPLSLGSLLERDEASLPVLLQILSTSQFLSDLLVQDPEGYDLLRITEGQPVARDVLVEEICAEVAALHDERTVKNVLRRYKRRETLRIAYGDIVRNQPIETVTRQISYLADAVCEAAVLAAHHHVRARRGIPRMADGCPARLVVLALGKQGGRELNYSSDIDLMFLYEGDGRTDGEKPVTNAEYFERVVQHAVKLLSESTPLGIAYRVDLRLRPEGSQGPLVMSQNAALQYYDVMGRTWERQAFVKARPVAGDLALGSEFLKSLEPWIYRRYLSRADITGIKALKRRIEKRARREEGDQRNVKTGHGGIRDIEFVIQFLQLLNGADLPEIRTGNTLEAIARLEQVGCLTMQERSILEANYGFLRKLEHRLQIMFDLQTHTLPEDRAELAKVALRMGFEDSPAKPALVAFLQAYAEKTSENHTILNHLLHDAFRDDEETEPVVDLVLDPEPTSAMIETTLNRYGFQDVPAAYRNLMALATEKIRFLSTRRCRHFLASISPRLLETIAATPDPDATLVNLNTVSESLGGKGVLWELLSFNPPSLDLYVKLCASSPYLSGILTSSPGMIDELLDSLLLDRLPSLSGLRISLTELCRGAEDTEPILHSFKNSQHLAVGVRDILDKDDIRETHRALSDIAETCLVQVAQEEYARLSRKFGEPVVETPEGERPCELIILAMGKLGGREPNYHSDLDIVFVYEAAGQTRKRNGSRETTTNQHFFSELGQRIIKTVGRLGAYGRLFEIDARLRPTGKSGSLAVAVEELANYFAEGRGQLWERQALCKARTVFGSEASQEKVMRVVRSAIIEPGWNSTSVGEIRDMRRRLEETATPRNLKRGPGGTVDIEFTVQMLQLAHAAQSPEILLPGTLEAIGALAAAGHLAQDDAEHFANSYRFLRSIESGLRHLDTPARHDLPEDRRELEKLAYLLNSPGPQELAEECYQHMCDNRERFERIFERAGRA